jgi:hypothetical protein
MPEHDIVNAAKSIAGSGFIRKLTMIPRRWPRGNRVASLFDPDLQRLDKLLLRRVSLA